METGFVRFALCVATESQKADELEVLEEELIPEIDTTNAMQTVEFHELEVKSSQSKASIVPQLVTQPRKSWLCCCFGGD
jgi:hypothetical protein